KSAQPPGSLPFAYRFKELCFEPTLFDAFIHPQQIASIECHASGLNPFDLFRPVACFQFKPTQHAGHVVPLEIALVLDPVIYLALPQSAVPGFAPIHKCVNVPKIMGCPRATDKPITVEAAVPRINEFVLAVCPVPGGL